MKTSAEERSRVWQKFKCIRPTLRFLKIRACDYISLTDIARYRDAERSDYILQNWMRNRDTIEFMGLWESFYNPGFNSIEFDGFKNDGRYQQFFADSQTMDRKDFGHRVGCQKREIWRRTSRWSYLSGVGAESRGGQGRILFPLGDTDW